jgi:large repetitive protein
MRRLGLLGVFVVLLCLPDLAGARPVTVLHWPNSPRRHFLHARSDPITPSYSANLRGGVAIAGNTLVTCPENVSSRRRGARRPRGRRAAEACLGANNNDHNMVYVNSDPSGHFNSSSATLTLPAGARVVHAYLYWGADLARGVQRPPNDASDDAPAGGDPVTNTRWRTASLRVGSGSYATIDATAAGRNGVWESIPSWYQQPGQTVGSAYQVRAEVTNELQAGISATRRRTRSGGRTLTVTVANVQAGKGYNRHGGWSLVVVWESPTARFRNITLFDGFEFVQVEGGQQLVVGPLDFKGFSTPASGPVDAHVTVWAYEGDRAITGDYLALGNTSSSCSGLPHQKDELHPVDNFFNSRISAGGVDLGGRSPEYSNQLGFDLATLNLPEGTIANGATGASVCLGSVGDTYFFGGLVFDSLIRAPNVQINKVVTPTDVNPGSTVTYTTQVTNPQRNPEDPLYPTAAATNLVTNDPLPSGLDFVGVTNNPGGICSYVAATRTVRCAVGTLPAEGTFAYAYSARVSAVPQGGTQPLTNTACYTSNSEDQPDVVFNGCDSATTNVHPLPPPPPTADLGVVKTVSTPIVKPGTPLTWRIVGTNHGPSTSTGFVLADQLPPGVAFVRAVASAGLTCTTPPVGTSGAVTCTAPSVPPAPAAGSSLTLTITALVPPGTAEGTLLTNTATVQGDQDEPVPDPHPNSASTQTRVVVPNVPLPPQPGPPVPQPPEPPEPDVLGTVLSLHKSVAHTRVAAGSTTTFTLRIANVAENSALNVRVCDSLPRGLSLAAATGFRVRGRTLCASIGTLKVLRSKTLRYTVRVSSSARGRLRNTASATARNARTVRARASVIVIAPRPPAFTG